MWPACARRRLTTCELKLNWMTAPHLPIVITFLLLVLHPQPHLSPRQHRVGKFRKQALKCLIRSSHKRVRRLSRPTYVDAVREMDLTGNTIREVSQSEVVSALAAKGYNFNLSSLHHDVLAAPNGHWVLLASVSQFFNDLSGYPGTTNVLGDVVIDLDNNNQPVWVWNSFDHLDVNRHPYLFPDWTHSNALLYSTDDRSLLLSMRHQTGSSRSTTRTVRDQARFCGGWARAETSS